jgi:hypothetical protein
VKSYAEKLGAWGEAVAAAAFRRAKLIVKTQPLGNSIAFVDMEVRNESGSFRAEVQAKATSEGGDYYELRYAKLRGLLDHVEESKRRNRYYRFGLAVAAWRAKAGNGGIFVFNHNQLQEAAEARLLHVLIDRVPGKINLRYDQCATFYPLLKKEILEAASIARSYDVGDHGGWTDDLDF